MAREAPGKGQRLAASIDWQRRAPRRIHANAGYLFRPKATRASARRGQGPADGNLRALEVVGRMLSGQVRIARQNHASLAMFIIPDRAGHFASVGRVNYKRSHGIGAVVET